MEFGYVLTAASLDEAYLLTRKLEQSYQADVVKIIPTWGIIGGGWNDRNRSTILAASKTTIVRTLAGDPIGDNNPHSVTDDRIFAELHPFLSIKPHCLIQLGNEPNLTTDKDEYFIWIYNYWLTSAITEIRRRYPHAKIISPGFQLDQANVLRWIEILAPTIRLCDFLGVHLYEHYSFLSSDARLSTQHAKRALAIGYKFFSSMPWAITEIGINDPGIPKLMKLQQYRSISTILANPVFTPKVAYTTFFHCCMPRDIYPNYHIGPDDIT